MYVWCATNEMACVSAPECEADPALHRFSLALQAGNLSDTTAEASLGEHSLNFLQHILFQDLVSQTVRHEPASSADPASCLFP
jgi:hypothetical protein